MGEKVDDLHVGLPNWVIHARPRDAAGPTLTAVTDGSGHFHFANLPVGFWTVWEEIQPGWAPVTAPIFDVELQPGSQCIEVRFKNRQACAVDPYEPDDMPAEATLTWPNGMAQKHTLEPPADVDWIAFDAVAGWIYTLRTSDLLGATDTYLTLYDTDGVTLLAANDDVTPGDLSSQIIWQAPAHGRYFARARDYYQTGASGCLGYDLTLTVQAFNHLPFVVRPAAPTPTPTPTFTPTATWTPTATATPTVTRTPVPTLAPFTIPGLSHPKGIGVNLNTHRLYIASRDTHVVYEVDPLTATVVRMIPVGREPFGVAVNTTTNKIYVANFVSDNLSVINGATGALIKNHLLCALRRADLRRGESADQPRLRAAA
jgi:YVTN family beta-propeller protein